jgi:hypothetical protein
MARATEISPARIVSAAQVNLEVAQLQAYSDCAIVNGLSSAAAKLDPEELEAMRQ